MKRGTKQHANYQAFFSAAYNKIGAAMRSMTDDPLSKPFSRDEISTALATACIRAAATAIAPSSISADDLDIFIEHLPDMVREIRAQMGERGIGVLRS